MRSFSSGSRKNKAPSNRGRPNQEPVTIKPYPMKNPNYLKVFIYQNKSIVFYHIMQSIENQLLLREVVELRSHWPFSIPHYSKVAVLIKCVCFLGLPNLLLGSTRLFHIFHFSLHLVFHFLSAQIASHGYYIAVDPARFQRI